MTNPKIEYKEALKFKDIYNSVALTSISYSASSTASVKHQSNKTNPNIQVLELMKIT